MKTLALSASQGRAPIDDQTFILKVSPKTRTKLIKQRHLMRKTSPSKESSQLLPTIVLLFHSIQLILPVSAEGGTAASQETLIPSVKPVFYLHCLYRGWLA